jgi:hypothetical protein
MDAYEGICFAKINCFAIITDVIGR